jgi:hypothetical protein
MLSALLMQGPVPGSTFDAPEHRHYAIAPALTTAVALTCTQHRVTVACVKEDARAAVRCGVAHIAALLAFRGFALARTQLTLHPTIFHGDFTIPPHLSAAKSLQKSRRTNANTSLRTVKGGPN